MVAATAAQVVGQMNKADQLEEEGAQRRQMGEFQAQQAEADAVAEREAGEVRASKVRRQGKSTQSEAKAALAASGVEVGAGTPVRIAGEIARRVETDAAEEILLGTRKGRRLDQDAQLFRQGGERAYTAGQSAADSTRVSAFGSVLKGGAEIAKGWKTAAKRDRSADILYDAYDPGVVRIV